MKWRRPSALLALGGLFALPAVGEVVGRLDIHELRSEVFGNSRKLRVWLPEGYGRNAEVRYPVLYLNDGQNLFDPSTSTFSKNEWRVDETLTQLIDAGEVEPLIVVGIDHGGKRQRATEYLPFPDEFLDPPEPNPQGDRYSEFLSSEVFPFIEANYRVLAGAENRILGGSSYGALTSLYAAATAPDVAHSLLLESASLYVQDAEVLKFVEASKTPFRRIYIGIGSNEMGVAECGDHPANLEAVENVHLLRERLLERGLTEGRILLRVAECATHGEAAWADRFGEAIRFLGSAQAAE